MHFVHDNVCLLGLVLLTATAGFSQRLRVVHASPDAPAVDIYIGNGKAVEGLPFGEYTDYIPVPFGQLEYAVYISGTNIRVTGGDRRRVRRPPPPDHPLRSPPAVPARSIC